MKDVRVDGREMLGNMVEGRRALMVVSVENLLRFKEFTV